VGLSIDSNPSHIAWLRSIRGLKFRDMEKVDVTFPLIADIKMDVARKYGMIHPDASDTRAVRGGVVIDPAAKIRAMVYYHDGGAEHPGDQAAGRCLADLGQARRVHAGRLAAGDDVIVPSPASCAAADERVSKPPQDCSVQEWFFTFRKLPKEQVGATTRPK